MTKCHICGVELGATPLDGPVELPKDTLIRGKTTWKGTTVGLCFPCRSAAFTLSGEEYEARKRGERYVCPSRY
jgi:hypothetical protein